MRNQPPQYEPERRQGGSYRGDDYEQDEDRRRTRWMEQRPYRGLDRDETERGRFMDEQRGYGGQGRDESERGRFYDPDFGQRERERDEEEYPSRGFGRSSAHQRTWDEESMRERGYGGRSWGSGGGMQGGYGGATGRAGDMGRDRVQGSYPGRRRYGAPPRGYQRSDERIREDICDALMRRPELDASDVEVTVQQGEVTLEGSVSERHEKFMVEQVSDSVAGVKDVNNRLRIKRDEPRGDIGGGGSGLGSSSGESRGMGSSTTR